MPAHDRRRLEQARALRRRSGRVAATRPGRYRVGHHNVRRAEALPAGRQQSIGAAGRTSDLCVRTATGGRQPQPAGIQPHHGYRQPGQPNHGLHTHAGNRRGSRRCWRWRRVQRREHVSEHGLRAAPGRRAHQRDCAVAGQRAGTRQGPWRGLHAAIDVTRDRGVDDRDPAGGRRGAADRSCLRDRPREAGADRHVRHAPASGDFLLRHGRHVHGPA